MKVLHCLNNLTIGGAERLVVTYVIETKDDFQNVVVVLSDKQTFLLDELKANDIEVISFANQPLFTQLILFIQLLRKEKFDVVHAHLFPTFYLVAIASFFYKDTKYFFTEHNSSNKRRGKPFIRPLEQFIYSRYTKIIACAEEPKMALQKWIGADFDIITIPNGIKPKSVVEVESLYDFILIGSLRSHVKGVDLLLEALSQMKSEFSQCAIVGDGCFKDSLISLRDKLNLSDQVHFLGNRADVFELLGSSKVVVMPSRQEGLPMVLLEAMSQGKPIIVSAVSSIPKLIQNHETGILVPAENIDELLKAMRLVLQDQKLQISLGTAAKKEFNEKYHISNYCEQIARLYESSRK
ncbi:MAG: glycosyltransferase [Turicibacter sp.]